MKCQKCQQEVFLPFKCPYCGGYFCSEHRLPENHECPQIELARLPKEEAQPTPPQKQRSYEYTVTLGPPKTERKGISFSVQEIRHLTVAVLLVMGIGVSYGLTIFFDEPFMLAISTAALTTSFFTHEIAHKIAAQRKGLWAEFRLTLTGAILTLLSIVSPFFKIISPGAVMIAGPADRESIGKISIAGPATNIMLSTTFLAAAFLLPQHEHILMLAAAFNAWIALFNLIPFGIIDGFKIFLWNKGIWALTFTVSLILTVVSYKIIL